MQKAQEDEMLALFNAVPKKQVEDEKKEEEIDPDAGPTFTDITQEIEYQRANVVAKTKITDTVFQCASVSKPGLGCCPDFTYHSTIYRVGQRAWPVPALLVPCMPAL